MKVQDGFDIHGIRFSDEKGQVFLEKIWCTHGTKESKWITHEIEEGLEIIGLQAYTGRDNFCRLGWLFWYPKVLNEKHVEEKQIVPKETLFNRKNDQT